MTAAETHDYAYVLLCESCRAPSSGRYVVTRCDEALDTRLP